MSRSVLGLIASRALILGPVLAFIFFFFLMPIWTVLVQSVSDPVISRALPDTIEVLRDWDGNSPPSPQMQAALVKDLRALTDAQQLGDVVRRLNSAQAGYRTLLSRTTAAVSRAGDATVNLTEVDPRWQQPVYWQAIIAAAPPITDQFLLAAVDYARDAAGSLQRLPATVSANQDVFIRTFTVAATVTLVCLVIGYPYAMLLAASRGWIRVALLACVLLPLWTSLLVRTASWYVLLQDQGLINSALRWLGVIDDGLRLLFTRSGVVIAMSHVLLPLMVLPIYAVLITIPPNLLPAAASLGARPVSAFLRITLPLSAAGVASGGLLVFMSAIGYYITPALIGGPTDQMISSLIAFYATGSANWSMAAAFGVLLLVPTLILYFFYSRLTREQAQRG